MPSLVLFILLLSLSIEACSRTLSFGSKDSFTSFHDISKDADEASLLSKHLKKESKIGEIPRGATARRLKELLSKEAVEVKREAMSGVVPNLSHVKVSMSPVCKNCNHNPGFHVDYVGPRTHPPAHN